MVRFMIKKKGFGVNAEFRYPTNGGFGGIAESLGKVCKKRIQCGMKVTKINVQKKEIEFNNCNIYNCDRS